MIKEAAGHIERLRSLARGEHDDLSIGDDAADYIVRITSVDGVKLETTAGERIEWWVSAHHARCSCKQCRLLRDHDTLTTALASEKAANALKDERILALETALKLAAIRLEILTGRMRACNEETGKHELLDEAEMFCREARTALEAK